ncbi:MAG: ribonuclease R [Clostridia bacterium]|nr:ribonuclease R [Clostridia bacterium]
MKKYYNSGKKKNKGMQGHRRKSRSSSKVHRRIGAGLSFSADTGDENLCRAIVSLLGKRRNQKTSVDRIASELKIRDISALYSAVNRLENEGRIFFTGSNCLSIADESIFVRGSFRGNRRGFGFVTPDGKQEREEDIFIPEEYVGDAIDGDTVICELLGRARRGENHGEVRPEGRIVRIEDHTRTTLTGNLVKKNMGSRKKLHNVWFILPDDDRLSFPIVCEDRDDIRLCEGHKIEAEIVRYPNRGFAARARMLCDLGEGSSREANYEAVLRSNGIKIDFPNNVLTEAQEVSTGTPRITKSRLDLREKVIFTIDGADAKDLDDAISLEKTAKGWLLGVHIADVSHYVRPGSALDGEAMERGTSVYFTDKVVPMLPRELSNGICSLNAGVQRYTLSALIELDKNGAILDVTLAESLIRSKVRGVYSEVNDIFKRGDDSEFAKKYAPVKDSLELMYQLYKKLKKRSAARGALELETAEAAILLDENGEPTDILRRERGDAERMIEQFMLCANEAVANKLCDLGLPCVYRIHENPDPEKLSGFCEFAYNLGLPVTELKQNASPAALGKVISAAEEKGIASTVSGVALRALAKAKYSAKPSRHFGLGIEKYCHFTSPIRRYPDLATHRIIKNTLINSCDAKKAELWQAFAKNAAEQSSENELRAVAAERDIDDLYKCIYMSARIGQEYDGIISSVTSFGMFVELENTCEGMIPITDLDGWYEFDEKRMTLSKGMKVFSLGMPLRIRVEKADVIRRKVEFSLINEN